MDSDAPSSVTPAPLPVAALVGRPPPSARPVEPVTPEEVAALARRIRVEAKLSRIAVVGTALGLVCGAAAVWPFLDAKGEMVNAAMYDGVGGVGFLAGWLLAGLLPLLAFYAGRLHFQSGRSTTGELETSLRKIRRVILGCMFLSVAAFVVLLASRQSRRPDFDDASLTLLSYALCFAACAFVVGDVRRGLGDFDSEQQRRRRKLARGFAVELLPASTTVPPDDIPLATVTPATAIPRQPLPPPPASRAVLPATAGGLTDDDEYAGDFRLLLTLAVCVAVAVHGVRLGFMMANDFRHLEYVLAAMDNALENWTAPTSILLVTVLALVALAATVLLVPCAALWIVWGVLSLTYGPMFRRSVWWLTWVSLVLGLLCAAPGWVYGVEDFSASPRQINVGMLARAPEVVHALFLAALLTRPGVRRLLARSRADDVD